MLTTAPSPRTALDLLARIQKHTAGGVSKPCWCGGLSDDIVRQAIAAIEARNASGSGKSEMIPRALAGHPLLQPPEPGAPPRYHLLNVASPATVRSLAIQGLEEVGSAIASSPPWPRIRRRAVPPWRGPSR